MAIFYGRGYFWPSNNLQSATSSKDLLWQYHLSV